MNILRKFLEPEVRNGFYIPSQIKQCWAVELEILSVIDSLCQKYGIKYYAEYGTFLGAIRHGGFIPWDDDLDIGMHRKDLERFLKVAHELPDGFEVQSFHNRPDYTQFIYVVVNTSHIRLDEEFLNKNYGMPYICGIDIFVMDNISDDANEEKERCTIANYVIQIADSIYSGNHDNQECLDILGKIQLLTNQVIDPALYHFDSHYFRNNVNLRIRLYEIGEYMFTIFNNRDTRYISQLMPWGLNGTRHYPRDYYNELIRVPYENTTIPVPSRYDSMLKERYGNYMKLLKDQGAHGYPCFAIQKVNLKNTIVSEMGCEAYDSIFPSFKFSSEMLKVRVPKSSSIYGYRAVLANYLETTANSISLMSSSDDDILIEMLQSIQQDTIECGNIIEIMKDENHCIIPLLEQLCELLYNISAEGYAKHLEDQLVDLFSLIAETMHSTIINRREIVLLSFGAEYWNSLENIYNYYSSLSDCDVFVVPIPYYYKTHNVCKSLINMQYSEKKYPLELELVCSNSFDLELHHPDVIVTQFPYDEYDNVIGIDECFYCKNLREYTNELIYIPYFTISDFDKSEERAYMNMSYYCTMPGIIYSDRVILSSKILRELYIEKLVEWSCEEYREVWSKRTEVAQYKAPKAPRPLRSKQLLYYIGLGQFLEGGYTMLTKIESTINQIMSIPNSLQLIIKVDESFESELQHLRPELYDKFKIVVDRNNLQSNCIYDNSSNVNDIIKECDAFYGDAGYVLNLARDYGLPCMIQNIDIQ